MATGRTGEGTGAFRPTGGLEVRLARNEDEVHAAQRLRFEVFYGEMSARPDARQKRLQRDLCPYDAYCDHMLVLDHNGPDAPRVIGTYRLLPAERAALGEGFYSAREFDLAPLLAAHPEARFLELGRSCVRAAYRNRRTLALLWDGVWAYAKNHAIDIMLGCASFPGTDVTAHAPGLSFLHHFAQARDPRWRARAHPHLYVRMDHIAQHELDKRQALRGLPPLIKGYLRLGAMVGDGAVIDHKFSTLDVLIILPVEKIAARYLQHFKGDQPIASGGDPS